MINIDGSSSTYTVVSLLAPTADTLISISAPELNVFFFSMPIFKMTHYSKKCGEPRLWV